MCHQSFEARIQRKSRNAFRAFIGPQAPHATVDFQVVADFRVQGRNLAEVVNYRRQTKLPPGSRIGIDAVGHHQDASADSGVAQSLAFVEVANRQPFCTFALKHL